MNSRQIQVRACPSCSQLFKFDTVSLDCIFGGKLWTDGKLEAPMYEEIELVGTCPSCSYVLWVEDTEQIDLTSDFESIQFIESPKANDYLQLLCSKDLTESREQYVRIQLWQYWNDQRRSGYGPQVSEAEKLNLEAIARLVEPNSLHQMVLLAEVNRELGRFQAAMSILSLVEPVTDSLAMYIGYLASLQDSQVREFGEVPQQYASKIALSDVRHSWIGTDLLIN